MKTIPLPLKAVGDRAWSVGKNACPWKNIREILMFFELPSGSNPSMKVSSEICKSSFIETLFCNVQLNTQFLSTFRNFRSSFSQPLILS